MGSRKKGAAPPAPFEKALVPRGKKGRIKVALVYPNTYGAGMSSLGFQKVFQLFDGLDAISCERVFLPPGGAGSRESVKSLETGRDLSGFDLIAASISFENDYVNLVRMLACAGIPPRQNQRHRHHPLVMAGGVACFLNPEPLAPFVDCFLLGEVEETLAPFMAALSSSLPLKQHLDARLSRQIPGLYIPRFYTPCHDENGHFTGHEKTDPQAPDTIPVPHISSLETHQTFSALISDQSAFKGTCLIETGRGCHHGCRFCSAGFIYRPPRIYPASAIIKAMDAAAELTDRIGLVSAAVSDHPRLNEICRRGIDRKLHISFSSLRLDALGDELVTTLGASNVKTATIAPEAGTQRMRDIINKKITEPQILEAAEKLVHGGIFNIKLYFMIGLPFETDDDIQGIVDLTLKIREVFVSASQKRKKIGTLSLSINPFVPKPVTPFQWMGMAPADPLKKRADLLTNALRKIPNVKLHHESHRMARVNALLARGDRRASDAIEAAARLGWSAVMQKKKWDFLIYRELDPAAPLPWDILESRVKKSFLLTELKRAMALKTTADCPMMDCRRCGICR